jgi:hypothetical protein
MPDLTPESARAIVDAYGRARATDAAEHPLGMAPAEQFAVDASALGLTEDGFDWTNWGPYERGQISDPEFITQADAQTLRRIATAHFRTDRFVGGHLAQIDEAGLLEQLVGRLSELVERGEI